LRCLHNSGSIRGQAESTSIASHALALKLPRGTNLIAVVAGVAIHPVDRELVNSAFVHLNQLLIKALHGMNLQRIESTGSIAEALVIGV